MTTTSQLLSGVHGFIKSFHVLNILYILSNFGILSYYDDLNDVLTESSCFQIYQVMLTHIYFNMMLGAILVLLNIFTSYVKIAHETYPHRGFVEALKKSQNLMANTKMLAILLSLVLFIVTLCFPPANVECGSELASQFPVVYGLYYVQYIVGLAILPIVIIIIAAFVHCIEK